MTVSNPILNHLEAQNVLIFVSVTTSFTEDLLDNLD
jgi:hypothetical protein